MGDFEKEMEKLSDIAERLSSGTEGIEKSMELYQQGVSLADMLQKKLNEYKTQVETLKTEEDTDEQL